MPGTVVFWHSQFVVLNFRPHQHGADVLPALSHIITHCTSDNQSTAVALAMDALYALCETEVWMIHHTC